MDRSVGGHDETLGSRLLGGLEGVAPGTQGRVHEVLVAYGDRLTVDESHLMEDRHMLSMEFPLVDAAKAM